MQVAAVLEPGKQDAAAGDFEQFWPEKEVRDAASEAEIDFAQETADIEALGHSAIGAE